MSKNIMSKEERKAQTKQNNLCRKWEKRHGHDRRIDGAKYSYGDVLEFEKERETLKARAKTDQEYKNKLRNIQFFESSTMDTLDRDYKHNMEHEKKMKLGIFSPIGSKDRKYFEHHYKQEEAQRQFEKDFREKQATRAMLKKYGTKWETTEGKIEVYKQLIINATTDKAILYESQREEKIKYYQNKIAGLEKPQ
jgi:hypothetical protein